MELIAKLNKEYAKRFVGVALLLIAFAGWFLYDGAIGYPEKNAKVAPVAAVLANRNLSPAEWMNAAKTGTAPLVAAFREAGFDQPPTKITDAFSSMLSINDPAAQQPEVAKAILLRPLYSQDDILAQYVSASISLAFAALLIAIVLWRARLHYRLDEKCLSIVLKNDSVHYPLERLYDVDDAQWHKRGILRVRFKDAPAVTLDAWHYANMRPIAEHFLSLKSNLPHSLNLDL